MSFRQLPKSILQSEHLFGKNGKFGNMREFSSYQGMLVDPLADLFSLIGWLTHYNGWVAVS